jgi:hypothetical protein
MNGVLGAIFRFDNHALGDGIEFGNGAMDGGDYILGCTGRQDH